MTTLPSLNPRHKAGLLVALTATGASLLLDASAKQTAGVVLLGVAAAWFVGSVAVRTLGIILSAMTFCIGLYVAVSPIWKDRESVLAAAQEYDATLAEVHRAAAKMEAWEKYAKSHPIPPGAVLAEGPNGAVAWDEKGNPVKPRPIGRLRPIPSGARLGEPVEYQGTVDIPLKWLRSLSPEEEIAAKHGGSVAVFLGEVSEQEIMREFQTNVLLPRPAFSVKHSIASHRIACLGGGSLSLLGLSGCVIPIWQARKAKPKGVVSQT